jgi:hypothetical protein
MRFLFIPDYLLDMGLSPRAVLAAGLILSRLNLSATGGNNWRDENGVFCYYSVDDLSADLHINRRQTSNVFSELLASNVIERRSNGNRLYRIYAGNICHAKNCMADMQKIASLHTIYSINKNSSSSRTTKKLIPDGIPATYDISLYESSSVIDEENGGAEE